MTLFVDETGPEGAPAIVFLHGAGVAGWMWRAQVAALSTDHRCLVPDLPEHGKSRAEGPFSIPDAAARVAALIRARATGGRAHVVGLSLGGQITVALLATAPEVVDHAICSGTNVRGLFGSSLVPWSIRVAMPLNQHEWFIRANLRAIGLTEAHWPDLRAEVRAGTADTLIRATMASLDFRVPGGLERVTAPTLVIAGEREPRVLRTSARQLAAAIPGAEMRLAEGAIHLWNVADSARFNATVRAWIHDRPLPPGLRPDA